MHSYWYNRKISSISLSYFEILEKYSKKKLTVGCSNIFARQEGREGEEVVLKEKYKNKTVTFTTDEDLENFEIIKNKVKIINIYFCFLCCTHT